MGNMPFGMFNAYGMGMPNQMMGGMGMGMGMNPMMGAMGAMGNMGGMQQMAGQTTQGTDMMGGQMGFGMQPGMPCVSR